MGPNSKASVIKALGALTDAVRSLEVTRVAEERQRRELTAALVECTRETRDLSSKIGEIVASHTKANREIIEIRRDQTDLRREQSLLQMRMGVLDGAE